MDLAMDLSGGYTHTHDLEMPLLLLVCRSVTGPRPEVPWLRVEHQCAGVACRHERLEGMPLRPSPVLAAGMEAIHRHWYETSVGTGTTPLSDLVTYRRQLRALGLDCEHSYPLFREGLYPIDLPQFVELSSLTEDPLPEDLNDLLLFDEDPRRAELERALGVLNRWSLAWLDHNSD